MEFREMSGAIAQSPVSLSNWRSGLTGLAAVAILIVSCVAPFASAADSADSEGKAGHGHHDLGPRKMSPGTTEVPFNADVFRPDPNYEKQAYDPQAQIDIYGAKSLVKTQRPLIELGQDLYNYGTFADYPNLLGDKNPIAPSFFVYGDWRTAVAVHNAPADQNGDGFKQEDVEVAVIATRLNLDLDWQITGTERVHAFIRPVDHGAEFTRYSFGGTEEDHGELELDGNIDALFFEGDLANIFGGFADQHQTWDMPFAVGLMPLLFQNGVWVEDAFTGFAFTIPAQNSPALDITNMDVTFFTGFDRVTTGAVPGTNAGVRLYGVTAFIETMEGYWEMGYGYTDDNSGFDGSYHNFAIAFTRRYGAFISNSVRLIANVGQDPTANARQTADGFIILIENSLITSKPSTVVPYFNFFAGFDKPQSLARDAGAGGILKNTGILFETDGLTGFPTLDATGNDTVGFAAGINLLFNLDMQLVLEMAALHKHGNSATTTGDEIGFGVRYQIPLNNAMIFRADAMVGFRENGDDLAGIRAEFRWKF